MKIAKSKIKDFKRLILMLLAILFFIVVAVFAFSYFMEEELKQQMIDESIDPEEELLKDMEDDQ